MILTSHHHVEKEDTYMLQSVPLTTTLGIEIDLIIEADEDRILGMVDETMFERLTTESNRVTGVQRSIQLDANASLNLASRGDDIGRSEEIECCGNVQCG